MTLKPRLPNQAMDLLCHKPFQLVDIPASKNRAGSTVIFENRKKKVAPMVIADRIPRQEAAKSLRGWRLESIYRTRPSKRNAVLGTSDHASVLKVKKTGKEKSVRAAQKPLQR